MENVTIKVDGLRCKSCVSMIESKINSFKGIESIKVNLAENNAEIKFNPEIITLEKIKSEIKGLGYSVGGENNKSGFLKGILYGLIPHIGCIGFLTFSILGVTAATSFFKPLLMNPYFFYTLILMSFLFATASATIYLRKNGLLSIAGVKKKKSYLLMMYGTTIAVNLLLFMVVFPYATNLAVRPDETITGSATVSSLSLSQASDKVTLKVDIPCPGHAPLITGELYKIIGVSDVEFGFPDYFDVTYDGSKTSKEDILSLEVFKTYKATITSENTQEQQSKTVTTGCGCGSCSSCGAK